MTKKLLITKFNFGMTKDELKIIMPAVAPNFSAIPGCCWKIWLINEEHKEAGGIYLFESAMELEHYLNSELLASVANNPAFSNLKTDTFSVDEAASVITGAFLKSMKA